VRLVLACLAVAALAVPVTAHAAPTGRIQGTVRFEGAPPERPPVRRDTDPYCNKGTLRSADVIVTSGKLRDVLVRVKNGSVPAGVPAAARTAPPPAVIDQKDCAYAPRVIGLVAGQQLAVRNSDGTFHNVHGTVGGKLVWNKPAAPGDPALTLDGSPRAGDVIEILCDIHPWMHAYAVVQDHAAFTVTGDDGAFELQGLPPGTYTVEAWHPTLGTRATTVTVAAGKAATARLSYGGEHP
jgi:plastocyanin